jgi:hypothetical protein
MTPLGKARGAQFEISVDGGGGDDLGSGGEARGRGGLGAFTDKDLAMEDKARLAILVQ